MLLHSGEVARALQVVGDRWSFLLMRDAFLGVRRFEDLRRRTGASRGTLTARLNAMVDSGLCTAARTAAHRAGSNTGSLKRASRSTRLRSACGRGKTAGAASSALPPKLIHTACGKSLNPSLVCAHCETGIGWRDMVFKPGPGAHSYPAPPSATRRRESAATSNGDGVDTTMFHSVDTVGDRWTALLVGALFFGLHRYDDINAALGIATNILADRLRRLLAAGVIEQRLYQDHPPRHEYHLTDKGWDLLQFTIAMHDWGTHWIPSPHGPGLLLRHRPCGKRLRVKVVCGSCGAAVEAREVQIRGAARQPVTQRRGGQGKKPLVRRT